MKTHTSFARAAITAILIALGGLVAATYGQVVSTGGAFVPTADYVVSGAWIFTSSAKSSSASGGIGYATGAGCTVTQATNKSTGVTCTGVSGAITMNAAALNTGIEVGFTVTDASIAVTDVIVVNIRSGGTVDSYQVTVDTVAAGSFRISVSNASAGNLSEALLLNFAVIKGVAS